MVKRWFVVAFVVATLASAAGCGSTEKQVSSNSGGEIGQGVTGTAPASGGSTGDSKTSATSGKPAAVVVGDVGLTTGTISTGDLVANAAAVLVNNGGSDATFFKAVFNFKDAAGQPVATETEYVDFLGAGATGYAAVDYVKLSGPAVTVEVTTIVERSFLSGSGSAYPLQVTSVMQQRYGGIEVLGTVENPTSDVGDFISVTCVLRSGGTVVGGAGGYVDTLPPGSSVQFKATTSSSLEISADSAECAATDS